MTGLIIDEREFKCLPQKQQMCLLYQNQLQTMELIRGYKFYQKITATIGSFLAIGLGFLFKWQFHL